MMQVPSIISVVKDKERGARRRAADLDSSWHGGGTEGMAFGTYAAKALVSCIYLMLMTSGLVSLAQFFYKPRYQTRPYSAYHVVNRKEGMPEWFTTCTERYSA